MSSDLIVIGGAPGCGKTTICRLLQAELDCPYIELGRLRELHLDREWLKASPAEEFMSFENAVFMVRNYLRYGYRPVILTDLEATRVEEIPVHFRHTDFRIFSLICDDDNELKRRVLLPERDSGYRDYASSILWNRGLIDRPTVRNEVKIDNTVPDPHSALAAILAGIAAQG